ncbi:MAG: FAD-dependent oxidoreductase [Thermoleophilia bacterium]|nr:FAD-dependent oxidoreductase [Thermoleophilia bacterium]
MEKVDCIIVGGGLAGLSAAYGLAAEGLEAMVIERGDYSGAKNVTGGRLYMSPIRHLYPELWEAAPFERPVVRELVTLMGDGAHTTIELASERFATPPHQSYTVLRASLDQWFADQVMEKGGMVITKNRVDDILLEDGKVIGIRAGGDDIGADVTIVAEGVLGLLAAKAGLREEPKPEDHAVGFKEIVELPAGVIQDRWRLNEGEGAAHLFMGSVTRGMLGGGFIYTNRDSLCLGIVVGMEHLRQDKEQMKSWELLDAFKEMPLVKPLVDGGTTVEYSAHAIYEGGIAKMPKLYGDGYLLVGDTAGLSLNALVTVRGMDFAIASGYYAARAVVDARARGDFSASSLAQYEQSLKSSFVLKDLETAREIPHTIENPRLFSHYPQAVSRLMEQVFTIGPGPAKKLSSTVIGGVRKDFLNVTTIKELLAMRKI